ncbi:putative methyltransferase-domain-containing protein [Hyaloraphidium curvatum]|nr:putative methyltransferase-domain-containing protein [Hyaloraphidium curvatum]
MIRKKLRLLRKASFTVSDDVVSRPLELSGEPRSLKLEARPNSGPSSPPLLRPKEQQKRAKGGKRRPKSDSKSSEAPKVAQHAARISAFHALEKRIAASTDPSVIAALRAEQELLGGIEGYQKASLTGGDKQRGGETGKWFAKTWMGLYGKEKITLLDVGAIHGTTYSKYPWIEATSIDLNPLGPTVVRANFFTFPPPPATQRFDVVCLSLVLNFVGSLPQRAEMLRRTHSFLKPEGHLFVVLPLACLANSRYMDHDRFRAILRTLGFEEVAQHDSSRLTHWLLKRCKGDSRKWKREEIRGGVKRNNFVIVVK